MATIGSIAVTIVANTGKFTAGLKGAQSKLGAFVKSISAAQTIVGGFTVYGLARMTSEVIRAGDEVFDASAKLKIGTEALGALRFAAEQNGIAASSLDRSLGFLNRTIGNSQQGSTEASKALSNLGLSAQQLTAMSLDQRFLAVAESIKSLATDTEQAAAAQAIFGRSGMELLPILRAGQEEIMRLGLVAQQTGSLFTEAQAERANNAADSLNELTAAWRGLRIELVEGFIPAITATAQFMTGVMRVFRQLQLAIAYGTLQIQGVFQDTSAEMASLERQWRQFNSAGASGPIAAPQAARSQGSSAIPQAVVTNTDETAENTAKVPGKLDQLIQATKDRPMNQVELITVGMR